MVYKCGKLESDNLNWKNKDILVTGANHFIAVHLLNQLVKSGSSVKAFIQHDYRDDLGLLLALKIKSV